VKFDQLFQVLTNFGRTYGIVGVLSAWSAELENWLLLNILLFPQ